MTIVRGIAYAAAALAVLYVGHCAYQDWQDGGEAKAEREAYRRQRDSAQAANRILTAEADRLRRAAEVSDSLAALERASRLATEASLRDSRRETTRLARTASTLEEWRTVATRRGLELDSADVVIGSQDRELQRRTAATDSMRASNDSLRRANGTLTGQAGRDSTRIDQLEKRLAKATGRGKLFGFLPLPKLVIGVGGAAGRAIVITPDGSTQVGWGMTVGAAATFGYEIHF